MDAAQAHANRTTPKTPNAPNHPHGTVTWNNTNMHFFVRTYNPSTCGENAAHLSALIYHTSHTSATLTRWQVVVCCFPTPFNK